MLRRSMSLFSRSALGLLALTFAFAGVVQAQDPEAAARVNAHLAAGEFGPARAIADGMGGPARDALLGQIARAQAFGGGRRSALDTLGGMTNDQARAGALGSFAGQPLGGAGGAAAADFESLIELITTTVRPTTWEEVGGPGAIAEFPGGVYVDTAGLMKKITIDGTPRLTSVHRDALFTGGNRDVHLPSNLRKVSLTRLERELQLAWADGRSPDEVMANLAGMREIKYVLVYPATGDVVIAGPAGDWKINAEGRTVCAETGRPVLQLDDLVVLLRSTFGGDGSFTCSIVPVKENLARTQAFLAESAKTPLKPGAAARDRWLSELRENLGKQDIEVKGLDPRTRVARTIVEADYHMKLVGMGLEEGTLGVENYLDSIKLAKDEPLPPMNVLRWWFTLNYEAIQASEGRNAFEMVGQGVKVLSENEMLTERGERVHTGKSDELTSRFASTFTANFDKLCEKYPVYAELQNIFDLALVAAVLKAEDLPGQANWHMTHFAKQYQPQLAPAPTQVETIINHRVLSDKRFIAGVSGGVAFRPQELVERDSIKIDNSGDLSSDRTDAKPMELPKNAWWWD